MAFITKNAYRYAICKFDGKKSRIYVKPTNNFPGHESPKIISNTNATSCDSVSRSPNWETSEIKNETQKIDFRPNLSPILGTNSIESMIPVKMANLK